MNLSQLAVGQEAHVEEVVSRGEGDAIALRLLDLGFVPGEAVRCIALAPFGGDPLLVQVGFTRFALRASEAARIQIAVAA
jgi:ferrous iron transport protein A